MYVDRDDNNSMGAEARWKNCRIKSEQCFSRFIDLFISFINCKKFLIIISGTKNRKLVKGVVSVYKRVSVCRRSKGDSVTLTGHKAGMALNCMDGCGGDVGERILNKICTGLDGDVKAWLNKYGCGKDWLKEEEEGDSANIRDL